MAQAIENYALLGDRHTAALVGRNGSVDWLCLPRFDSAACFNALLGGPEHGRWLLGPTGDDVDVTRRYIGRSSMLETSFTTPTGVVTIVDVMPTDDGRADLVRQISGVSGRVRMRHEWIVRLDYGRIVPWVSRHQHEGEEVLVAIAGPDKLVLRGPLLPVAVDDHHAGEFEVTAGEVFTFCLTWVPSHKDLPPRTDLQARIESTRLEEEAWAAAGSHDLPHDDLVVRSLVTLRQLTHSATGGIVAAPTTSLPEAFGGERNWDYRYCWLRDASLTLEALLAADYTGEARLWRAWLLRAVAGDPEDLQIMYAVDGGRRLPERELNHLPGYADSSPVRIGNAAVDQRQTDVLGQVMVALEQARDAGLEEDRDSWSLQRELVEALARNWSEPDHGLWEIRAGRRHFTHSRVMVWVAFDRAVRACEVHGFEGPVDKWRELRDEVHREVLERGFDATRGTFTQHYDTTEVDAALLVLPLVGFLPGDDPRMLGTIRAIEEDLMRDGLVLRYRAETGIDGLRDLENPFLACSFWLVSAYAEAGLVENAERLFDRLCGLANDVGLLSEEYDVVGERMAGNFPQAFSHLTLVQAALRLKEAQRRAATS